MQLQLERERTEGVRAPANPSSPRLSLGRDRLTRQRNGEVRQTQPIAETEESQEMRVSRVHALVRIRARAHTAVLWLPASSTTTIRSTAASWCRWIYAASMHSGTRPERRPCNDRGAATCVGGLFSFLRAATGSTRPREVSQSSRDWP